MFKVPTIPSDLRHEETIIQAAYALDCLQNTIGTIFGRIDKRLEKNNTKVKELQERINISRAKINSLQGTRKAIRIYAPARFPATTIFKDLAVTFDEESELGVKRLLKYHVESKLDTNLPSFNEKLVFFHVRDQNTITPENNLARERCNIKQNQDLGYIPSDLRSVQSVLLFNTDLCLYNLDECEGETIIHSESWKRSKFLKSKRQQGSYQPASVKQILEPAPHSLAKRRNEKLTPSGGLKYTPKLSEAPELDLPLDLPDLPGIADDLRYDSLEAKQKIAPSLALIVDNLPELTELIKDSDKNVHNSTEENTKAITPAPPPPPLPIEEYTVPPPPPPPPVNKVTQIKNSSVELISSTSTDTRSELMAAIRNAGGIGKAPLRATAAAPLSTNDNDAVDSTRLCNPPRKKPTSQGGDLMADLHNKLLMRRKGISGTKDNFKNIQKAILTDKQRGNPVMSRLSALIPPPPAKKYIARKPVNTSEEDDEDDSNDTDWVD